MKDCRYFIDGACRRLVVCVCNGEAERLAVAERRGDIAACHEVEHEADLRRRAVAS